MSDMTQQTQDDPARTAKGRAGHRASRGIGYGVAERWWPAATGVHHRARRGALKEAVERLGSDRVVGWRARRTTSAPGDRSRAHVGGVRPGRLLVNNAGTNPSSADGRAGSEHRPQGLRDQRRPALGFAQLDLEVWQKENGGAIVNMRPSPGSRLALHRPYGMSKAAMVNLTSSGHEFALPYGHAIAPAVVKPVSRRRCTRA